MNNCNWHVISEFSSPFECARFFRWRKDQIESEMVLEVTVKSHYIGLYFDEKWFQCLESNEVWRLVFPQDPFHGYWGPVSDEYQDGF